MAQDQADSNDLKLEEFEVAINPMQLLPVVLLSLCVGAQAAEWTTRPLGELAVFPEFRAPVVVIARDEARLAAEVSARVVAMPVREGQAVRQGAELVRLDDAGFRIEAQRARLRLTWSPVASGWRRHTWSSRMRLQARASSVRMACVSRRLNCPCWAMSAPRPLRPWMPHVSPWPVRW